MRSYGQFCPVAKAAEVFCERWTALIIRELIGPPRRFSELQRGVPLMSPSMLSRRLRQLEAEGVIRREGPPGRGGTYRLTEAGAEFAPIVEALGVWGQRWTRRDLNEDELDLGLLVWSLEKSARADAFGNSRTVVYFEFSDQPVHKSAWWFVNADGRCQLCIDDPGWEVDLGVFCELPTIIRVIRGDIPLAAALNGPGLELAGPQALRRRFGAWLNLGPLTRITPMRDLRPQAG